MTNSGQVAGSDGDRLDWYPIGAIVAALAAAALQLVMIGGPLVGYHGYNESFYFTHALQNLERGLVDQVLRPIDPNNPFLYPFVLATWLRVFGSTVAAGRLLGVALSIALVLLTFWVARRLYNERIALLSAVCVSVTPGVLLTGRNMQTDTLMVVLALAAVGALLRAMPRNDTRWAIASGVLFGLSFLAKLPAVLYVVALVVWQVWRTGGVAWAKDRAVWVTAVTAAVVAVPWYGTRLFSGGQFASTQGALAENAAAWESWDFIFRAVWGEQFWMLTPAVALAAALGIVIAVRKRSAADTLLLSVVAVFSVFFMYFNFHSYYFIALLPFFGILASRGLWTVWAHDDRRVLVTIALVVMLSFPLSVLTMSAKKWTAVRLDEAPRLLERAGFDPDRTTVGMSSMMEGSFGPAIAYYFTSQGFEKPQLFEQLSEVAPRRPGDRVAVLSEVWAQAVPGVVFVKPVDIEMVAPVAFGYAFRMDSGKFHFYAPGETTVERVGPLWWFGLDVRLQGVDFGMFEIGAGER